MRARSGRFSRICLHSIRRSFLKEDCTLPPSAYTPAELDVFQTVIRQETLVRVLESSRMTDTALLRILDGLLRKGVFGVARGPQVQLEETCNVTAQELLVLFITLIRNPPR